MRAGALGWWLAPLPFTLEVGVRFPVWAVWKEQKRFLPHPLVKLSIVGSLRDREVACSVSDLQGLNFESCVRTAVSSHHPQEVLLAQFSRYVHKSGLKPDSFHFISFAYFMKLKSQKTKLEHIYREIHLGIFWGWDWTKESLSMSSQPVIGCRATPVSQYQVVPYSWQTAFPP